MPHLVCLYVFWSSCTKIRSTLECIIKLHGFVCFCMVSVLGHRAEWNIWVEMTNSNSRQGSFKIETIFMTIKLPQTVCSTKISAIICKIFVILSPPFPLRSVFLVQIQFVGKLTSSAQLYISCKASLKILEPITVFLSLLLTSCHDIFAIHADCCTWWPQYNKLYCLYNRIANSFALGAEIYKTFGDRSGRSVLLF